MTALTLVDFLRARLDEEQQSALAQWSTGPSRHLRGSVPPSRYATPEVAEVEIDAKRRIVDLHTGEHECPRDGDNCGYWHEDEACTTLRLIALPYAQHPDYRQEWKP